MVWHPSPVDSKQSSSRRFQPMRAINSFALFRHGLYSYGQFHRARLFAECRARRIVRGIKRKPEITSEGMQTILEEIAESRVLPSDITPQPFIDSRFFKDLSSSGFIDALLSTTISL